MAYWLLKTEPESYSFADLVKEKRTVWDGVANNWALKHLRAIKKGDKAFIYHSGRERAIVGIAEITSNPYSDPKLNDDNRVVVDVIPLKSLSGGIRLKQLKEDPAFGDFLLVKFTRLSVMPVPQQIWQKIIALEERESI